MIAIELALFSLFCSVAYWLDRENRRTNRINVGLALQNDELRKDCERLGRDNAALAEALNAATGELGQVRDERDAVREELKDEIVRSGELLRENKIWAQEAREREAFKVEARRVMGRRWLS